jgi:hypothetical protein
MVDRIRKVRLAQGQPELDAIEMPFQNVAEHWNEYLLQDGSVLRLKSVVTDVLKLDGKYDAEGNPIYVLKSAQVVSVSPSERARKPTDSGEGSTK